MLSSATISWLDRLITACIEVLESLWISVIRFKFSVIRSILSDIKFSIINSSGSFIAVLTWLFLEIVLLSGCDNEDCSFDMFRKLTLSRGR